MNELPSLPFPHLLERVRRFDARALEEFYRREYPIAFRLCFGFLLDRAEAEDAAQDALLKLNDGLSGFDSTRPWTTWRNTVVLNVCRDRKRREGARRRAETEVAIKDPQHTAAVDRSPHDVAYHSEAAALLRESLAILSPREREVFILRDLEEQESPIVAASLDISEGTVRSLLSLARKRLRQVLESRLVDSHDRPRRTKP